jgi:dihydroorotate dehydrogenase electron transfer subunit
MIERAVEIVINKQMTSDTYLMGLRSPEIVGEARAGQFVMIQTRTGREPLLRRPFSISGTQEDLFLVLYRVVGQGTLLMAEKREGESLSVLGPLGKGFELPTNQEKCLLVAGGVGVAPLFFLAQKIRTAEIEFMMGFRTADEILKNSEVDSPNVSVAIATDDGTYGHAGLATDLLEAYIEERKNEKEALSIFTCGPTPMLKKVALVAKQLDLPCQVSLEAAMACGLGACQGCAVKAAPSHAVKAAPSHAVKAAPSCAVKAATSSAVKAAPKEGQTYRYVCKDGPVFPVQAIDWDRL